LQAEYLDLKEWFSTGGASLSPSNTFIQALIKTEHPTVSIIVNTTTNIHSFCETSTLLMALSSSVPFLKMVVYRCSTKIIASDHEQTGIYHDKTKYSKKNGIFWDVTPCGYS
jgi:hypothetical protein